MSTGILMDELLEVALRLHVGVSVKVPIVEQGACRDSIPLEQVHNLVIGPLRGPPVQVAAQLVMMLPASQAGGEPGVVTPRGLL